MNIVKRIGEAVKALRGLQYYDPQEQAWTPRILEMGPTRAGVAISETTALKVLTVYACIRNISEDIAKLPMHLYKHLEPRGKERQRNDIEALLNKEPNPEMSAFDFKMTLQGHKLGWGNGFAEIEFNDKMRPTALWILPPDRMTVKRRRLDEPDPRIRAMVGPNEVYYEIRPNYVDNPIPLPAWKVFHLRGLGFDGLVGYSPVRVNAEAIGVAMAQERHAGAFFGNGAYPGVMIKHPARLQQVDEVRLKQSFENAFRGPDMHHRTVILQDGMTLEKLTINPTDAQLIESRKFSIEEICRMYRVPPHKVGHLERATFSNIEQQNTEYVTDCLMSHAESWEQEADRKLNLPKNQFFEHKFNALLKGDAVSRATFYSQMRNVGALSTNDIRELENLNPVGPEGDALLVQGAMISLESVANGENVPKPATNEPKPGEKPAETPKNEPNPGEKKASKMAQMAENHAVLLADVLARSLKIEAERVARAAKKPAAFETWKAEFYGEHQTHLFPAVRNVVASFVSCCDGDIASAGTYSTAVIQNHISESKRVTATNAEVEVIGWNETRAQRFAKDEIGKIAKELTK